MYGFERLIDSIDKGRELDANTLLERLMDDVTLFVGGAKQHDDLTFIVMKVKWKIESRPGIGDWKFAQYKVEFYFEFVISILSPT